MPKGGPNGGDGGAGGDIVFASEDGLNTLYDFRGKRKWKAMPGEPGRKKQQHGADAPDTIIRVPPGTLIYDDSTGDLMHDMKPGESVIIAKGGRGGFGNEHFKSPINQTPREATPGEEGERYDLRLELKLIADVGLVGMPNAGKSTLLRSQTRATPKVADYPFTTLSPQLGIAELDPTRRLVLADIPGLIEGAAQGAGLGHDFLRHIERTKILIHMLDVDPPAPRTPAEDYKAIRAELAGYSRTLAGKREIIALNKLDLFGEDKASVAEAIKSLSDELAKIAGGPVTVMPLSGASGLGAAELMEAAWQAVHPGGAPTVEKGWVGERASSQA